MRRPKQAARYSNRLRRLGSRHPETERSSTSLKRGGSPPSVVYFLGDDTWLSYRVNSTHCEKSNVDNGRLDEHSAVLLNSATSATVFEDGLRV